MKKFLQLNNKRQSPGYYHAPDAVSEPICPQYDYQMPTGLVHKRAWPRMGMEQQEASWPLEAHSPLKCSGLKGRATAVESVS